MQDWRTNAANDAGAERRQAVLGPCCFVSGVAGNDHGGEPDHPRLPSPDSSSGATCMSKHAPVGPAGRNLPHRMGKGVRIVNGPVRDKPPPSTRTSEADARRMGGNNWLCHCHIAKLTRRPAGDGRDPRISSATERGRAA